MSRNTEYNWGVAAQQAAVLLAGSALLGATGQGLGWVLVLGLWCAGTCLKQFRRTAWILEWPPRA